MTEPKRSTRRTTTRKRSASETVGDDNPYLDSPAASLPDASPSKAEKAVKSSTSRTSRTKKAPAGNDSAAAAATDAPSQSSSADVGDRPPAPPAKRTRGPSRRSAAESAGTNAASSELTSRSADTVRETRDDTPRFAEDADTPRKQPSDADSSSFSRGFARSAFSRSPLDTIGFDPAAGPNVYDLAFDRTDGPERQGQTRETQQERPYNSERRERGGRRRRGGRRDRGSFQERNHSNERHTQDAVGERSERPDRFGGQDRGPGGFRKNGRRGRNRFRRGGGEAANHDGAPTYVPIPSAPVAVEGSMSGWFDPSRDGGFLRQAVNSYLPDPGDPFISPALVRLHQLRRGDRLEVTYGRDHRGRYVAVEVQSLNDGSPVLLEKRPEFNTLTASYPDRKLTLETGRPAKSGPELTRRAIDLIAPIGYGQRALIVAPARAGKTTLLQAIVEGVAINHPQAVLFVLLVDERPEEVSEMITWGYGEVVASSFDMPPKRHVEVAEMTLERARRLVELGKDVVIVLDSITRLARAHNTVDRGTGRTMSGGLDATAMQKPKAFFGSARMIAPEHGGGSLTIIATALVETGSRMDDVIFEEFKGTGNCEIKLDRSLADRRIYPAFDIATSGTRREEKLYRPDQVEKVHLLRRGLHQLPPQAGMEWLIKRIAGTPNNDSLLDGL